MFGRHTVEGSAGALIVLPEGLCCLYHEKSQCSASLESCALPSEYQHITYLERFEVLTSGLAEDSGLLNYVALLGE